MRFSPKTYSLLSLVYLFALTCGVPAWSAELGRLGAIGDSLTDEYSEQTYDYALSWTELLAQHRGVDFGPTAADAGVPGNSWSEPRRTGFEDNWARYGDTTERALTRGQASGVAAGVDERGVTHVVMLIGGNDFSPWAGGYDEIYNGSWGSEEIDFWIEGRLSNIAELLNEVDATGAEVTLASVLDFSAMPLLAQGNFSNPARRDRVTAALEEMAHRIRQLAVRRGLVYVDAFAMGQRLFGSNTSPRTSLLVGNVEVETLESDSSAGTFPEHAWVDDGVHPNTVIQGIIANVVVAALNLYTENDLAPFSEEEILSNAGLSYGGSDTLTSQIGQLSDLIADFRGELLFLDGFE